MSSKIDKIILKAFSKYNEDSDIIRYIKNETIKLKINKLLKLKINK